MAKILVVDDSEIARAELVNPLKEAGHDISEAGDGKSALEFLEGTPVEIVITDVHMPHMTGIELCEAIRDSDVISHKPPILVVSTESNPDMKTRGKAAGVKGWIIKPVDTSKLCQVVDLILKK